ncbi:MAG: alpha-amylase family glycosyl hydrolase [Prevotellaceae bacterium]|nr:alpha-amylase family glycosyl hydrolase [Prevotellaceae bacterium]
MKRFISTIIISVFTAVTMTAQGWQGNYQGVMLQGFYWDSFIDTQWSNLESQADELSEYFDLIWVPQSGNCNTTSNVMGYAPVYWYDQNSSFGTESQLRSMINTFKSKNVGVIADVVINHRGTLGVDGSWVDFPAETYNGVTYQLGLSDICRDDDNGETAKLYDITGANDTGEGWDGMRDLDHTSQNVQDNVIAYLNFLKNDLGYEGFRYDMTKGYSASYTGLYNSSVNVNFSVGEYFDGNLSLVKNWIDGTKVDGTIQSASFDFPTRYSVRDACNNNTWNNLSTKGLIGYDQYKRYAITFIENHDTQYRSATETNDPITKNIEAGNAYILAMPGTPCVFLTHWKNYKNEIKQLITARKLAGITNESTATEKNSSAGNYAVEVNGTNGNLLLSLGYYSYTPDNGYTLVAEGTRYKLYVSGNVESPWISQPSGSYEEAFDVTLTALSTDTGAKLVYTTDGTTPTASSTTVESGSTITISTTTKLKVGLLTNNEVKNVVTRNYTVEAFSPYSATVYLKDPDWNSVYFYAWANDGSSTQLNGSWPGKTVSDKKTIDGEEWYYQSFDITSSDYSFNIIFNQGSNQSQTVDIGPINSDKFYEIAAMSNGKYTVNDVTEEHTSGIENTVVRDINDSSCLKVYTIDGRLIRSFKDKTNVNDALEGLQHGLYIVNNKKVLVK